MKKKIKIRIKKKNNSSQKSRANIKDGSLKERKENIKKQRKITRIKRRLTIFGFFFISICITVIIFKAPFFNIKDVVVVGQDVLTEEEILKVAEVNKGQNIFITRISDIKKKVAEIPYVSESNARRIFPNKVKIWVRESDPCLYVKYRDSFVITDSKTKVLEIKSEIEKNICRLVVDKSDEKKPGDYILDDTNPVDKKIIECLDIMEKLNMLEYANSLDFSNISDIMIMYDGRLEIKVGSMNDIEYKLKFINKVINENISEHEKATLDYTGDKLYVGQYEEKTAENEEIQDTEDDKNTDVSQNNAEKNEEEKNEQ